ncbi:DUF2622 domain-containing protein [Pseudomonas tolaasii]|uniref:DUF2622 domain-containing protein n=1 Tax=Pseudomonas tolaasii TaxID=29442 RepID=UPI0015A3CE57|nr:DUF2622 domain-containing protein [Pseudomonas tolaasii]NWC26895.1 DUF2622 domain-containing protein [Pseudomonas tolaasii]
MAEYMVRVGLSNAEGDDYSDLHDAMEVLGLKRAVVFENGKRYKMPNGTYFGSNSLGTVALRDKVKSIADPLAVLGTASVFVCQSQDWQAWLFED